jgi:hypothetical protein
VGRGVPGRELRKGDGLVKLETLEQSRSRVPLRSNHLSTVMPAAPVAGIHVFLAVP